ncbi:Heparinase II/III-like protein [Paenibacillus sp. UNCCL117]|uniref:heparinase II/III family protein n=1 Tax=unclassified Paenibacillus TaxID=185978 RepID=UPI00088B587B|nr:MULTISPECIES: heparinase II/III family protein [unclassified Paenibacillus]SDC63891.1 Heparinase II/III-like protein [Paenibacillus sp. cl123]SFW22404.1 Heparinase II/III-like protein [Paenibacillus sp. UNCCL117]
MDANMILSKLGGMSMDAAAARLLLGEESPEQARNRLLGSAAHAPLIREIREEADRLLAEPLPELTYSLLRLFEEQGSRSDYDRTYFRRRGALTAFGLMGWLEHEEPRYAEALADAVWSICNEYTWCLSAHLAPGSPELRIGHGTAVRAWREEGQLTVDLFAAETAFALCEVAALAGERLPALLHRRIQEEVRRRVLEPFLTGEAYKWETQTHNWAAVCAGSIGAAAMYALPGGEELAAVLERCLRAVDHYLLGFEPDGACTEGYLYWQYGFGFYVYFADLLKRRTGGEIDLFAPDKVRSIAMFQQTCFLDGRQVVNFSDSLPQAGVFLGLTHYLHGLYPEMDVPELSLRAAYTDDHCRRWAPALRNLLWFREELPGEPWAAASYYLPDAQWLVSRHRSAAGSYVFAAKGGHNAEPHNHNDIGQFMLTANGTSLLADLGCGQYTREYFGDGRYDILCNGAQGHSVPEVDGQRQQAGASAKAVLVERSSAEEREVFAVELASAYAHQGLSRLERRFVWSKAAPIPTLELTDIYSFSSPAGIITERLISWFKPAEQGPGLVRIDGGGGAGLSIRYDAGRMTYKVRELEHTDHFGNRMPCYALDFTLEHPAGAETVKFVFTFTEKAST